MVIGAFPVAKLGALFLRQISKPISKALQERAKSHPFFRKYICIPPAQFYNACEVRMKMWVLNMGKPASVPVLNETMAIELGANLLGEGIIFAVAAGLLVMEYGRQVNKETVKENKLEAEKQAVLAKLDDLYFTIEKQETQIKELMQLVNHLEQSVVQKPWAAKKPEEEMNSSPPQSPPPSAPPSQFSTGITQSNKSSGSSSSSFVVQTADNVLREFNLPVLRLHFPTPNFATIALQYAQKEQLCWTSAHVL